MVIPIEESLIYVRPLYLRASGGSIPELTRVIVAYQDQIVMERTLEEALARLFGASARPGEDRRPRETIESSPSSDSETSTSSSLAPLAAEARAHYDRAIQAQRAGDWGKYGEEIRLLGETLQRMGSGRK